MVGGAVLRALGGSVLEASAEKVVLEALTIQSFGGDKSAGADDPGAACAVKATRGTLTIKSCGISSQNGSGVLASEGCDLLVVGHTDVGPCGRHGVVLGASTRPPRGIGTRRVAEGRTGALDSVTVHDCEQVGLAVNEKCTLTLTDCRVNKCPTGLLCHPAKVQATSTSFSGCGKAIAVYRMAAHTKEVPCDVRCASCKIVDCKLGLSATGVSRSDPNTVRIRWDATNEFGLGCPTQFHEASGGVVERGGRERAPESDPSLRAKRPPMAVMPADVPLRRASSGAAETGDVQDKALTEIAEEENFAKYCRLLHEVCPAVLVASFRFKWHEATGGEWTDDATSGGELLAKIDDVTKRKLGKEPVNKLRAGASQDWDVTILTTLLLFQPGFFKDKKSTVVKAIEQIRTSRNALAHSTKKRVMSDSDFKAAWADSVAALGTIMSVGISGSMMQHLRESMDKVLREKGLASHVDRFMTVIQGVESQMARLSDVAEEANTKAQKSVSKTEAGRMIKSALMDMGGAAQNLDVNKLPVTIQLENGTTYTLLRRAGVGGFGTVFVAQDTEMDLVAFKVCEDQGETDRGDREAQIMQKLIKLKHPNIAAFLSNSKFQGKLIIVMELVKGDSLDNILAKEGTLDMERAKTLMLQLTDGMGAVHSEKIAHRDLKPGNIMIDEVTGNAVIVDFGLSKEQNVNSTITNASGAKIGTALYMSPEQTEGVLSLIGPRADVWALGVIFYEILTGDHPFLPSSLRSPSSGGGKSASKLSLLTTMSKKQEAQMTVNICELDCPPLPPARGSMTEVVQRALKKEQNERYGNASEMHAHLKDVFSRLERIEPADKTEGAPARPLEAWTVTELAALVRSLGGNFAAAAAAIEENGIDGKTWRTLDEGDFLSSVQDGGLGLKKLQLKRVLQELGAL